MTNLLQNKVAIVVGGGQTAGETIGNGRATAIQFAREGARVAVADRNYASAEETVKMINDEGLEAMACELDVRNEDDIAATRQEHVAEGDFACIHVAFHPACQPLQPGRVEARICGGDSFHGANSLDRRRC